MINIEQVECTIFVVIEAEGTRRVRSAILRNHNFYPRKNRNDAGNWEFLAVIEKSISKYDSYDEIRQSLEEDIHQMMVCDMGLGIQYCVSYYVSTDWEKMGDALERDFFAEQAMSSKFPNARKTFDRSSPKQVA